MLAVVEVLPPGQNWFYHDAHRLVYDAMLTLFERRDPIDLQTVTDTLYRRGHLEKIGGSVYLAELTESVGSTVNTAHHARIVREKALYRDLINVGTQLSASAYEQAELPAIVAQAHQALLQVANAQTHSVFATMTQLMSRAIHDAQNAEDRDLTGLDTGLFDLNRLTSGWQNSDLIILAARPSMGKTALALQLVLTVGRTQALPVLFFSLEMSKGPLATGMLCSEARMDASEIRRGGLSQTKWGQLMNASNRLCHLPVLVDDTPSVSMLDVRTRATRLQMDGGLGLIVIE
jgi:replicative DNA helicase